LKDLRQAVWAVDPNLPLFSVNTLDDLYRRSMAQTSFTLILLAAAGGMALFLGVVGLYGVVAYSVSQRTREIGVRMALGAEPRRLTGMFVREGLTLAIAGVVLGTAGALLSVRLMASLLFGVSASDPATFALVAAGLVVTLLVATYLPSRRAAAVHPATALRAE
jgi:ABC-type antimicrobial peptide transport system permease subunit